MDILTIVGITAREEDFLRPLILGLVTLFVAAIALPTLLFEMLPETWAKAKRLFQKSR